MVSKIISFTEKLFMQPDKFISVALGIDQNDIKKNQMNELQTDLIKAVKESKQAVF